MFYLRRLQMHWWLQVPAYQTIFIHNSLFILILLLLLRILLFKVKRLKWTHHVLVYLLGVALLHVDHLSRYWRWIWSYILKIKNLTKMVVTVHFTLSMLRLVLLFLSRTKLTDARTAKNTDVNFIVFIGRIFFSLSLQIKYFLILFESFETFHFS